MNKIKQINISDFRIYQGKQEFKFQNERGIANLVALYAPNGYGKTSFFDAIEWGYSDKIERIGSKDDKEVQELDHNEDLKDKIILTNRVSYKKNPNVRGQVEIESEKGYFIKQVVLYTRRNTNGTKNDYTEGNVSGDFKIVNGIKLVESNILTQDHIDSFLRYKTPEQKFEALKEFWSEGEDSLNKYKKVEETFKNIEKKIKELGVKQVELSKELSLIVFDPKNIETINSELEKLEASEVLDCNFTKLEEPISKELVKPLSKELNIAKQELTKKIEAEKEVKFQIEQLKTQLETYITNKHTLGLTNEEIIKISDKKKTFESLKSATSTKEELEVQLLGINNKLNDLQKIEQHKDFYLETKNEVVRLNAEIERCNNAIQKTQLDISITEKWISSLTTCKSNASDKFERVKSDAEYFSIQSVKYFSELEAIKTDREKLPTLKSNTSKFQTEIQTKSELIRNYQSYITEKNWLKETFISEQWVENIERHKTLSDERVEKQQELKVKQEKLQKSGSLEENLNRIKLWGKEYIENTKHGNCPLCNTSFETFEALLTKIDSNTNDLLNITEQKDAIVLLQETVKRVEKNIEDVNQLFTIQLNNEITKLKENIESITKLKEASETEIITVERRINNFSLEYKSFTELVGKRLKGNESFSNEIIPVLIERSTKQKDLLSSKIERIKTVVEGKHEFLKRKHSEKTGLTKSQSDILTKVSDKENNEIYKRTKELIQEYQIKQVESDVNDAIEKYTKEKESKGKRVAIYSRYINLLRIKINTCACDLSEIQLDGTLADKYLIKTDLETSIKSYEEKYKRLFISPKYTKEELETELIVCTQKHRNIDEYEKRLFSVIADLELIDKGLRKLDIEKELVSLKQQIEKLVGLKTNVANLKDSIMTYIEKGISNYFNKDVINQIYQRIEPHPELKEIGFNAENGPRGPRLVITAIGDNDKINPNLYLSAGQVNVLSLSIFLAKAFEYGKDTISTIFMDDPIQNLSDINILSFIDILRTLTNEEHNKQIVISTHDEKFFRLLQNKLPEEYCNSKFIEFESEGKLKKSETQHFMQDH